MARRATWDPWLIVLTALLVAGGWFMVGSSSNYLAVESGKDPSVFGWKHLLHVLLGSGALVGMLAFPYQRLADRRTVRILVTCTFVSLVAVLSMPEIAHARRWISVGFFNVQPSELAKLTAVVYMAWTLSRREDRINELWAVPLRCLLVVGSMALLVVVEPDLGSAVVPVATAAVLIFVAGLRPRYVLGCAGLGLAAFIVAVLAEPYRVSRVLYFVDPWRDPLGKGYQLCQSLIALGNGGLTGMGLGGGGQRALFLPAPHTDFIFSVIGEDFGLIGCCGVLAAFLLLFWRGLRAAVRAPDRFGFYLALGLTSTLVLQGLINMCVCLGLLPTKGLPLPFISYGGSSLLVSMAAMGLLLNVSMHSR